MVTGILSGDQGDENACMPVGALGRTGECAGASILQGPGKQTGTNGAATAKTNRVRDRRGGAINAATPRRFRIL